jgi:hypothetical protein
MNDPTTNMPQDPPRVVKRWDDDANTIFNHHVQNHDIAIFVLVKTNTLTYYPWSYTPLPQKIPFEDCFNHVGAQKSVHFLCDVLTSSVRTKQNSTPPGLTQ